MLCCLLSALMAGNLAVAGRAGVSLLRRPGPLAAIGLLIAFGWADRTLAGLLQLFGAAPGVIVGV